MIFGNYIKFSIKKELPEKEFPFFCLFFFKLL